MKVSDAATVRLFDDAFGGRSEDSQQAPTGADLRGVGTVALAGRGGVEPVDCAANVLPLRYFDTVGEDLDGQRVVGNFFSIGIQLCWGWIAGRSHLLCSFPCKVKTVSQPEVTNKAHRLRCDETLNTGAAKTQVN